MKKYILTIDQGTTGTTCVLINKERLTFVDKVNIEIPQFFPTPGLVEHDFKQTWNSVRLATKELFKRQNLSGNEIECIGITNQRETVAPLRRDGTPLAHAIVWQDRRTTAFCHQHRDQKEFASLKAKTGLPLDPYFSASKMLWLKENNQEVQNAEKKNDLIFTTVDAFLLYKLTDGVSFATDASNASRTLLMNIHDSNWDKDLLSLFSINLKELPEIKDSFAHFGVTKNCDFLPDGIPITGILGDQQAALLGQAGHEEGSIKCTYGTGAFMVLNTGRMAISSANGLLTTVAFRHKGVSHYALEGSSYIAGAAVQWLRDQLKIIKNSSDIEVLAKQVKNISEMKSIFFFPYFSGIGTPHWKPEAKAAIVGLTRDSSDAHLARACLEGIAFSINDLLSAFKKEVTLRNLCLKVDGGAVVNNTLMQIQANISGIKIARPQIIETTAYGAGIAAALGHGLIKDFREIENFWQEEKSFVPDADAIFYQEKNGEWQDYIRRLF